MRIGVMMVFACVIAASPVQAQPATPRDSLLDHLVGHWVLRGPMAGKSVVHDVTFTWALGTEYVEMHEVSRERTATGSPASRFHNTFVYNRASDSWALHMDNDDNGTLKPFARVTLTRQ